MNYRPPMSDTEVVGFLTASCSWDAMATACAEHRRALREAEAAQIEQFLYPSVEADVRMMCADAALRRAEGRLGR